MKTKVNCGDWELGWGYGGHDKIGKLERVSEKDDAGFYAFVWKGRSQGRHGTKWNHGAECRFRSDGKEIMDFETIKGATPVRRMLLEGVNHLIPKG